MSSFHFGKKAPLGHVSRTPQKTQNETSKQSTSAENIIELQGIIGNRAVMRMIGATVANDKTSDKPMLRFGSQSNAVLELQTLLNQQGANLVVDGIFGMKTYQAVVKFQTQSGLSADGIVGPLTWGSLSGGKSNTGDDKDLPTQVAQHLRFINTLLQQIGGGGDTARAGTHQAATPNSHAGLADVGNDPAVSDALGAVTDSANADGMADVMQAVAEIVPNAQQARENGAEDFQPALNTLDGVLGQVTGGQGLSTDLVTALGVTTTEILTAANQLQTPGANPKSFATTSVTKTDHWKSDATTIAGLAQDVDIHQNLHGEAAHITAQQPVIKFNLTADGKVADIQLVMDLHLELPEWTKEAEVGQKCPCWKKEWTRFSSALTAHEQKHVAIFKLHWEPLGKKCVGLTEKASNDLIDKTIEDIDKAQAAYDTLSDHGKNETPSTKFNGGVACDSC